MPLDFKRIAELGGVPIYYDRNAPEDYGKRGAPMRPFIDRGFAAEADLMFRHLFDKMNKTGVGEVVKIFSGGVSRDPSSGGKSYHHLNRAFDLDALVFSDGRIWVANTFPQAPHIYLGIESVIRRYFGTVLAYDYNQRHEDHFHFDNGRSVGFNSYSKSRVIYLQNALSFAFDLRLGRDGVWGPETRSALDFVRAELKIGPITDATHWLSFLSHTADEAFRRAAEARMPAALCAGETSEALSA